MIQLIRSHRWIILFWIIALILFISNGEIGAAILNLGTLIHIFTILIIVLSIIIIPVSIAISIYQKHYRTLKLSIFNFLFIIIFLLLAFWFPRSVVIDYFRGSPKLIGWYEGTQNQAKLTIRDNNNFDIWATGVFFADKYYKGTYTNVGNKFEMKFLGEVLSRLNGKAEIIEYQDEKYVRFYVIDDRRDMDFKIVEQIR